MKIVIIMVLLIGLTSCHASGDEKNISTDNIIEKKYFVKGMTCGGCILGVAVALGNAEKLQLLNKDVSVGVTTLKFDKSEYKKDITDCIVRESIEKVTEYEVFLDKKFTKRACES